MDQRLQFVAAHLSGQYTMTELCEEYGISRRVGYKWVRRYQREGPLGLLDRSRAPHHRANATPLEVEELLVAARLQWPRWGPKKLLPWLARQYPYLQLPSRSTAHEILKRRGLVGARKRRRKTGAGPTGPLREGKEPNEVWCADFKGQFRVQTGQYCYPLTITDHRSRFVLRCEALVGPRMDDSMEVFESAFDEYGLPEVIRTDNGEPFASTGLAGLSKLSAWWIQLGIEPQRIEKGHPEQNGRHERMHRTLKAETTRPPGRDLFHQQELFDRFQREFNHERPHEALEDATPSSVYKPSSRRLPDVEATPSYPGHFEPVVVYRNGMARMQGHFVHVGAAFRELTVAFEEIDEARWRAHFWDWDLGVYDEKANRIERYEPRNRPATNRAPRTAAGSAGPGSSALDPGP